MKTTLDNAYLTVQINSMGAELISIKDKKNTEYMWEGNPKFWGKHSPVLFPIVGALKNDTYQYNGKNYQLSRHGFAREMEFNLIENSATKAIFAIASNADTLLKYPFEFELQIIYTLVKNNIQIEYQVVNKNAYDMPFSIGAHPAFALPKEFEEYSLQFSEKEQLHYNILENNLIADTTKELPLDYSNSIALEYSLFENDALIFKNLQSKTVSILEGKREIVRVHYEDFPSLGIWTMPNAPFLCIEPWLGYADTVNCTGNIFEKEGILVVQPNEQFHSKYTIEII
ncbi:aldose 1-epimerase family protein [Flavobacterium algicola]|uniref:aldose 1-epimerase family protein n=1 Tax=Flavobacterium algicola TaxID=556529 RepID=UPI001EFE496B|nr:aldose 1-epimerase family protein [Flavobacterium algicola]MCG9792902.1 aldose 1-epimerase family protein [Flavobacterium algicola]